MTVSKFPWAITAEKEYEKDSLLRREDVKHLMSWIASQPHLPEIDEELAQHFLHACYYNLQQAKTTMEALYCYKNTMPEFFNNWDPSDPEMQRINNNLLLMAPLPNSDKDGNNVMICKLNSCDVAVYNYALCVKWLLMSTFHTLWTRGIHKGYVLVYDSTGFTMSHLMKSPISQVRNYINFGEKASPIRVLKIVFINTSQVVKKLMTLVKPFLNKELINMISFHTSHDTYFKDMPPDNIPEEYGGTAPSLTILHRQYVEKVFESKEWLIEEEKVRCDMSKKSQSNQHAETSFRRLEID